MINAKIYTVSELSSQIKSILEEQFGSLWLTGEISNFKAHSSGHFYFSIKDSQSQIQAVMFRGTNRLLKFKMEEGLEVIVNGRVTVYEPRGNYQIVVEYLEPKGLGALQLAFEQLKKKLEAEGLFEVARKKPLPFLPQKIGIVTSPTGAVIRDMLHVLKRRYPNIEILLNPVNVQGVGAEFEIAKAIDELNTFDDIDILIVGRGGGSLEDLWAFNTEEVARAIFRSKIPIISAVGHEIDFTLADFVADLRAPTPSAAAELAVPLKAELQLAIQNLKDRLKHPKRRLEELSQRVDELQERLKLAILNHYSHLKKEVAILRQTLQALSPLEVLKRGYSIVYKKGSGPIKNADQVDLQSELEIWLAQGRLEAYVTKKIDPWKDKR